MCLLGSIVLTVQFLLFILANKHKCIAWMAALSFFPWLWFFVKVNLVRFSHSGEVCFGDFLDSGVRSRAASPYLIHEGKFVLFLAVWQWIVIGLLLFGLISSGAVILLEKYYRETEADEKVFASALPKNPSIQSNDSHHSNVSENEKD